MNGKRCIFVRFGVNAAIANLFHFFGQISYTFIENLSKFRLLWSLNTGSALDENVQNKDKSES